MANATFQTYLKEELLRADGEGLFAGSLEVLYTILAYPILVASRVSRVGDQRTSS